MKSRLILLSLCFVFSCTLDESTNSTPEPVQLIGLEVASVDKIPENLKKFTEQRVSNSRAVQKISSELGEIFSLDASKTELVSYQNEPTTKAIITPLNQEYSHVYFSRGDLVSTFDLVVQTKVNESGIFEATFYDDNGYELFSFTTDAHGILQSVRFSSIHDNLRSTWWQRFGNCVKSVFNAFTNGNGGNAVVGLLCVYFGPECAIGTGALCAAAADAGLFENAVTYE